MDRIRFYFLIDVNYPETREDGLVSLRDDGELEIVEPLKRFFEGRLFRSVEDLSRQLQIDLDQPGTPFFPVELAIVDYNLTKPRSGTHVPGLTGAAQTDLLRRAAESVGSVAHVREKGITDLLPPVPQVNFDGLIGASLAAALFRDHPLGIVPTTTYGPQLDSIRSVNVLESLVKSLFKADFGARGTIKRNFHMLFKSGVRHLRESLLHHARSLNVDVNLDTLTALCLKNGPESLLVRSRYTERRLSIEGLFYDVDPGARDSKSAEWAREMLNAIFDGSEGKTLFHRAFCIQERIWSDYWDQRTVERQELARMAVAYCDKGDTELNDPQTRERFSALMAEWGVSESMLDCWRKLREHERRLRARSEPWTFDRGELKEIEQLSQCIDMPLQKTRDKGPLWTSLLKYAPKVSDSSEELKAARMPVKLLAIWMLVLRLQVQLRRLSRRMVPGKYMERSRIALEQFVKDDFYLLLNPRPSRLFTFEYHPAPLGTNSHKLRDEMSTALGLSSPENEEKGHIPRPNERERYWLRLFAERLSVEPSELPGWVHSTPPEDDGWPFEQEAQSRRGKKKRTRSTPRQLESADPEELLSRLGGDIWGAGIAFGKINLTLEGVDLSTQSLVLQKLKEAGARIEPSSGGTLNREGVAEWISRATSVDELRDILLVVNEDMISQCVATFMDSLSSDLRELDEADDIVTTGIRQIVKKGLESWNPSRGSWNSYVKRLIHWRHSREIWDKLTDLRGFLQASRQGSSSQSADIECVIDQPEEPGSPPPESEGPVVGLSELEAAAVDYITGSGAPSPEFQRLTEPLRRYVYLRAISKTIASHV